MQTSLLFDLDAQAVPTSAATVDALGAMPTAFWRSLEVGSTLMREYFEKYTSKPEPHVREMLVRYQAKRFLEEQKFRVDEEEEVHLGEEPLAALALRVGPVSFRILKGRGGLLPGCGRSRARRGFYSQQPQRYLGSDRSVVVTRLNLVVLWDFDTEHNLAGLWLACPRRAGERAADVDCYWLQPLSNPAEQVAGYDPHGSPNGFDSVGSDLEILLRRLDDDQGGVQTESSREA